MVAIGAQIHGFAQQHARIFLAAQQEEREISLLEYRQLNRRFLQRFRGV
jgi:hypothetical protein